MKIRMTFAAVVCVAVVCTGSGVVDDGLPLFATCGLVRAGDALPLVAPVCAVSQPKMFLGKADSGVCVDVPSAREFSISTWVNVQIAGSGEFPYPRIVQLPFGYVHLARNTCFPDAADVVLAVNVPTNVVPKGKSSWTFDAALPLRQWAHVAIVLRAGRRGAPEFYLNGVRVKVHAPVRELAAIYSGGRATIGNISPGGNRPLSGSLANFRFEARAISESEVADLARVGPDGKRPTPYAKKYRDELPIVDLSHDVSRQTVIASGADGIYQGHPTTAVAPDGVVYCVWTINHGGPCGPMAKSLDGGRTWSRCDEIMPSVYRETHRNCPTLQSIVRPDGGTNLVVFSAKKGGCGIVISQDGGKSWREAPTAKLSAGMPPTGFIMLKDGTAALFGQVRNDPNVKTAHAKDDQSVWMSISRDGGWIWGPMRIVATAPQKNLCEPFCIRSPDGNELCLLMRENRHTANSMMCFSRDEGKTWTTPENTCWGLSGDRHEGVCLPDGRLFVAFRDRALGSSTYGHYVAWVGSYSDLRAGKPGDMRVHLLENMATNVWDTGYSGVELLHDGTILCTSYLQYRAEDKAHSVVCTRLMLSDIVNRKQS